MSLTLTTDGNWRKAKTLIAASYNGTKVSVTEDKSVKVPTLTTPQGVISGADACAKYVARMSATTQLMGKGFFESVLVDQWMEFAASVVEPARDTWVLPVQGAVVFDGKAYAAAKKDMGKALGVLNNHLANETYLVGNCVTLADISLCVTMVDLFTTVFAPKYIKNFGTALRWFTTVVNQPLVKEVVGEVVFATRETQAPKPKKEAPKKEAPKKAAAAAPAPKKEEKPKDPILLLPPSSMILDAEKKEFFKSSPYNPEFFPSNWDRFDAEGYSLWTSVYNYNEDNKVYFMTQNALGGFLQRCDPARKFAFGVSMITGENEDASAFKIRGMWIFRGQEMPNLMKENPDAEWYTWNKCTYDDASKAQFEAFMTADSVEGEKVLDRRYFK
jgi:elongation factor 1-gamma